MVCTRCGKDTSEWAKYCSYCGADLQTHPPAPARPAASAETSGKAIASLICGVLFFFFPAAIAGIVLGHLALSDIRKAAGQLKGHGIAVAGLVLGYSGTVFIPIVLIIAAIAIPNLLRARIAANEASAVGSLQTIETAAFTYRTKYYNGFPPSLPALGSDGSGSPNCNEAQLIDSALSSGMKNGYVFTYEPGAQHSYTTIVSPKAEAEGCKAVGGLEFDVRADPLRRGTTGQRSFYLDDSGVIRVETLRPAASDSPPLQ